MIKMDKVVQLVICALLVSCSNGDSTDNTETPDTAVDTGMSDTTVGTGITDGNVSEQDDNPTNASSGSFRMVEAVDIALAQLFTLDNNFETMVDNGALQVVVIDWPEHIVVSLVETELIDMEEDNAIVIMLKSDYQIILTERLDG